MPIRREPNLWKGVWRIPLGLTVPERFERRWFSSLPAINSIYQLLPLPHSRRRFRVQESTRPEAETNDSGADPGHRVGPCRLCLHIDGQTDSGRGWDHDEVEIDVGGLLVDAGVVEALTDVDPESGLGEAGSRGIQFAALRALEEGAETS